MASQFKKKLYLNLFLDTFQTLKLHHCLQSFSGGKVLLEKLFLFFVLFCFVFLRLENQIIFMSCRRKKASPRIPLYMDTSHYMRGRLKCATGRE